MAPCVSKFVCDANVSSLHLLCLKLTLSVLVLDLKLTTGSADDLLAKCGADSFVAGGEVRD